MTLNEKYLTIDDLCDLLTVSPKTVASWRHRGVGPASFKAGKHVRYKRSDIDAWIEQNKCTPKDQRDEYLRDWEMYGEEIKEQQNAD
jgi:excisionase family DNA binding protein